VTVENWRARAHTLGNEHFGDAYTIERREFNDHDNRTVVKHTKAWSSTNYVTVKIWVGRKEVWREYHENDQRLTRDVIPLGEWGGGIYSNWRE